MEKHITHHRGMSFIFYIDDDDNNEYSAVTFTGYTNPNKTTSVFALSVGSGITKISDGHYRVRLAPSDTSSLTPGAYPYELVMTRGTDTHMPMYGTFILLP